MSTIAFHPTAFDRRAAVRPAAVRPTDSPRVATSDPRLQLTTRGRIVVLIAALLAVAFLAVSFGSSTTATSQAGAPAATHSVVVKPGQTLWQIATAANPSGDVRQTVDDIMELNSLPSAGGLQMGREIAVPVYND